MNTNQNAANQEVVNSLLDIIRTQMRLDDTFTSTSSLTEAGLDSLAMVRIQVSLEEKFGVWMEVSDLTPESLQNVETMAVALQKVLPPKA